MPTAWDPGTLVAERVAREALLDDAVRLFDVERIGTGAQRDAYRVAVRDTGAPEGSPTRHVVVLVPHEEFPDRLEPNVLREARLLRALEGAELSFRVPRVLGTVESERGTCLVEEYLDGTQPMLHDLALVPGEREAPEVLGETLASLHTFDVTALAEPGEAATRREHAQLAWQEVESPRMTHEPAGVERAREWMQAHFPPDGEPALLHGDLLSRNIVLDRAGSLGVLDWQTAHLGDPAYDVAILTRGERAPLGDARGLERLIAAHAAARGPALSAESVRFFELALLVRWIAREASAQDAASQAEFEGRLDALLAALETSGSGA